MTHSSRKTAPEMRLSFMQASILLDLRNERVTRVPVYRHGTRMRQKIRAARRGSASASGYGGFWRESLPCYAPGKKEAYAMLTRDRRAQGQGGQGNLIAKTIRDGWIVMIKLL